jgi:UDP-4-amino-4-deoxy-L-arabinose formyltransferase/UDP-glucuronic acid dehydrogenase (UDP-4-keto-hexauronic acid decarboxylating)
MVKDVDAGGIIIQKRVPISQTDTGYTLHNTIALTVPDILNRFFSMLEKGTMTVRKQEGTPTYYRLQSKRRNAIHWQDPAMVIHNIVRALTYPLPGAYTVYEGSRCTIWETAQKKPSVYRRNQPPGTFWAERGRLFVQTGTGTLEILRIEYKKQSFSGASFLANVQNNPHYFQRSSDHERETRAGIMAQ